jgi:hypothetical protein
MDDQRVENMKDNESEAYSAQKNAGKQDTPDDTLKREDFFTGLNFSALILSLSTSVLVNLGELPDPVSNEKEINLPLAKQSISIIEMLKEKTKGNLTQDEERLIGNMLYDLRMKYVEAASI